MNRAAGDPSNNFSLNNDIYSASMQTAPQPLRFSHHALAVLATALLGSTIFALLTSAAIFVLSGSALPGLTWLAWLTLASWFAAFTIALPGAAILFSLFWPMTRHGSPAGAWLCVVGGATIGIAIAPLASKNAAGASPTQMALFLVTGATFGGLYVLFARRLAKSSPPRRIVAHSFRHRLPPVGSIS